MDPAITAAWRFEDGLVYLNHGSFGATPLPIQQIQSELRARLESDPVGFLWRTLPERIDLVRQELSGFLRCDPGGLVLVPNATHAFNAVLGSIDWRPGEAILMTDHGYNACRAAAERAAERYHLEIHVAPLPWPVPDGADLVSPLLDACRSNTRLAVIDHVTSATAIRLPVEKLVPALRERGIETFIDGAHAPGMIDCDPDDLGATWYAGNLHKWICAPKGAAFLQTSAAWRERTFPCSISHGWNTPMAGRSRYQAMFDWTGTTDPTAWLCVPDTLRFMESLVPAGWAGIRDSNRRFLLEARQYLMDVLEVPSPCSEDLLGSMSTLPFPRGLEASQAADLRRQLRDDHAIEIQTLEREGKAWFRISRQLYNGMADYEALAAAIRKLRPGS
ncbi:MAG: aminotransferase class V-fold PLP-dependent enzyme [Akkermansiaceae bacterium]|jgi:isopenicillin-N epimerase|nr:aminotransferase class V-fold PLP-dependent enzyme [Akkermansiaceae bacterium]